MDVIIIDINSNHFRKWGTLVSKQGSKYLIEFEEEGQFLFCEKDFIKVHEHEKEIPKGCYCYQGTRALGDNNFKVCPYWTMTIGGVGFCKLLELSDGDDDVTALFDQVKECGINYDDEVV